MVQVMPVQVGGTSPVPSSKTFFTEPNLLEHAKLIIAASAQAPPRIDMFGWHSRRVMAWNFPAVQKSCNRIVLQPLGKHHHGRRVRHHGRKVADALQRLHKTAAVALPGFGDSGRAFQVGKQV